MCSRWLNRKETFCTVFSFVIRNLMLPTTRITSIALLDWNMRGTKCVCVFYTLVLWSAVNWTFPEFFPLLIALT